MLERLFKLSENRTTLGTELIAGLTTFMTMAYIIFVNPSILRDAGMPFEGVLFATCVSSAIATLVMGLYANYPIALAPGMGLNAYFTYTVCIGMGIQWQVALGAVFISGVVFLVLTLTRLREQIVYGIPDCIKYATAAGVGLFIAFIGLKNAKIVVASPTTFVGLGRLTDSHTLLSCLGLLLMAALLARRVHGALLWGIIAATLLAMPLGLTQPPDRLFAIPRVSETLFKLDVAGTFKLGLFEIVFVFLFVDMFDNIGTLLGICEQGGFIKDGKIPGANRVLVADAIGSIVGSLTGTSTVVSYIESASGVAAGGRTGLSNMVVAALFLLAVFLSPVAKSIPAAATAPALIIVGSLMMRSIKRIDWEDITEAVPAFITVISMPLTFSIATGLTLGFMAYAAIKVFSGRGNEAGWFVRILALVFAFRYAYLAAK